MTDPRLEAAVAAAYDDKSLVNLSSVTFTEARRFLAMLRAALPWLHDALRAFDQAQAKAKYTLCEMPEYYPKFGCIKSAYQSQPESEVAPHRPEQSVSAGPIEHDGIVPIIGTIPSWRSAGEAAQMTFAQTMDWDEAANAAIAFANVQLDQATGSNNAQASSLPGFVSAAAREAGEAGRRADPPWLDGACRTFREAFYSQGWSQRWEDMDNEQKGHYRRGVRAVLAFANAQPPSEVECKAAARVLVGRVFDHETNGIELAETLGQEVLIAAAKARNGA